ncbi:ribonuclease III [Kordiimonas laminariae]|uniref:ribonuclease III n=1 Tax=Kordiimonas laminariae TaxID=2917717 RepID=UPI001FF4D2A3|nr:ribonuclease III [Kordiimonas laminariae]MCK0069604.1 ribonuclease III [Kordiimonas laminariae]
MAPLKKIAGYTFTKASLLDEALTHPSLSGTYNYQRLEFLGDRVLGLAVSTWLLEAYPSEAEGQLNRRFTSLVRKETLAEMAKKLDLVKAIKLTPGAETEGTRDKEAVQADVCEAIIGAMYLDAGFGVVEEFIRKHWIPMMNEDQDVVKDSKTLLQEWCQARATALPKYEVVERSGPDHQPVFTIEATVKGKGSARAQGSAKRIAEQAAAAALFSILAGEK